MNVATTDDRHMQLLTLAREIARGIDGFHLVKGPGAGDIATHAFMEALRSRAIERFGEDCSEKKICGSNSFAVDFYFRAERTIVEVALGLPNPQSEFEKDVLKAIMSQECGHAVTRLFFISRPGAAKKCNQPGRTAVKEWAKKKHGLEIEVHDLEGEPRRRRSRRIEPSRP
jgi:hypothetical protein